MQNSTLRTIKLENIQESNFKNEVFTTIYNNRVLTKERNLFEENLPKNASESMTGATDRRAHDGLLKPSVIPYLTFLNFSFLSNILVPSTEKDDGPLRSQWSIDGFRSSILTMCYLWVLGYSLLTMTYVQDGPSWIWLSVENLHIPLLC